MPVEVGSFVTEVSIVDRDLPLTPKQVDQLVREVFRRLERKQREDQFAEDATTITRQAGPRSAGGF